MEILDILDFFKNKHKTAKNSAYFFRFTGKFHRFALVLVI
jgi:hypothetical protein